VRKKKNIGTDLQRRVSYLLL